MIRDWELNALPGARSPKNKPRQLRAAVYRPWLSFDPIRKSGHRPADHPGVYVFLIDGRAVYVGQSVNLGSRISAHRFFINEDAEHIQTPWPEAWPLDTPIICKYRYSWRYGHWLTEEARLIYKLRPIYNRTPVHQLFPKGGF
jgi:hypothetical protein